MKNVMTGVYIKDDESLDFDFYTELSMADKMSFVNSVVGLLVDDENKNYNSIMRDLVFDFCIVDIFTNIDTKELWESPFFIDDVEKFLEDTNVANIVKANIDADLVEELNKAINLDIQYKTGININSLNDALASLINTLEKKIKEINLDDIGEIADIFSGIDEITPENLVNAYINSNAHKENLKEIEEIKSKNKKSKK